ncbi:hypothetical protein FB45DRAFT_889739 [Roridomyces roridus]|uniref:Uncharacterized protein n=1 Tax=Roridomyces roridus TaxID=1738132 RepID=A0AAD7CKK0_9AGAR|nr:hypothetical protein FB45DRAFT_889739 [Roridomyces roridus]
MRIVSTTLLFFHFFLVSKTDAQTLTNRTIDDTNGDNVTGVVPTYTPSSSWAGPSCQGCAILPDTSKVFDGTYHAATYGPDLGSLAISMDFTGVAIYVYFILANDEGQGITTTTAANFSIDGTVQGEFTHAPAATTDLEFNALVFSHTGLSNGTHSLLITMGGSNDLYINFDYAVYTFEEAAAAASTSSSAPSSSSSSTIPTSSSTNSPHSSNHTGAIAGGVVGGVVLLLALCAAAFFYRRRRRTDPSLKSKPDLFGQDDPPAVTKELAPSTVATFYGSDAQSVLPSSGYDLAPSSRDVDTQSSSRQTAAPLPLPPSMGGGGAQTKSELRLARQMELTRQMQEIHGELEDLVSETRHPTRESGTQDRIRLMEEQIRALQSQQGTPWAQGLTDEPPPGYTPSLQTD